MTLFVAFLASVAGLTFGWALLRTKSAWAAGESPDRLCYFAYCAGWILTLAWLVILLDGMPKNSF
jgi:hypothetical protein